LCQSGNDINKVQPISYRNYSFKATRPQYGVMSVDKLARFYAMPDYKSALAEYLTIKNKQAILRSN
jgi:dTDP-4-dehydrorhamnose reductase